MTIPHSSGSVPDAEPGGDAALPGWTHLGSGKVRELYAPAAGSDLDPGLLLLVATDRISAYDHILPTPIPDKGRVLTAMTAFWFELLSDLVANHLVSAVDVPQAVRGRAMLVRRLEMFPVECVARGYLTGSGLVDYRATGAVCGVALPAGLQEASRLPAPIFTPAAKAELGAHDENITYPQVVDQVGAEWAERLRGATLAIYQRAAAHAAERGVILADTKFEFGRDGEDLILGDEVLTPDSSRFWPAQGYQAGRVQPSFDKQYVRDWLTGPESGWDRAADAPPPPLPGDVVAATRARYIEAYERISGLSFADWLS